MSVRPSYKPLKANQFKQELYKQITESLKDIKYGSVTFVVQDAHLIQIERNEKIRMV